MEGDLSVSSDSHLQHLTAAAASRPDRDPEQSQARCGVTRCRTDARGACLHQMTPGPKGSDGGEDRWHACRSVCLREKRLLKRLFEECVLSCVWKATAVSHAIKERPPDTGAGVRSHHTGVLWHLQTGGHTHSGLPAVFINLFSFSTTAQTLVGFTCTHMHTEFQGERHLIWEFMCYFYDLRQSTSRNQRTNSCIYR